MLTAAGSWLPGSLGDRADQMGAGFGVVVVSVLVVLVLALVLGVALLVLGLPAWRARAAAAGAPGTPRRAGVVVNPTKVDAGHLRAQVGRLMRAEGWAEPLWEETTREDHGREATLRLVGRGVDLVLVAGGDGTVMSVVSGLAGKGVPVALLPTGTGNLLARNLDLPMDQATALRTALRGTDRPVDLGQVAGDGIPDGYHFAVMAGMGFDAQIVDVPPRLKRTLGWLAYVVSGLRHSFDRAMKVTLVLDGGEPLRRRARTVVVGNVGRLQGGLLLLPDARPDDGVLDVVVIEHGGLVSWLRVAERVLLRRPQASGRHRNAVETFQARTVEILSDRPQPRQLDGDGIGRGTTLRLEVRPRALEVRVPAGRRTAEG